jgi:hypothetical protein
MAPILVHPPRAIPFSRYFREKTYDVEIVDGKVIAVQFAP